MRSSRSHTSASSSVARARHSTCSRRASRSSSATGPRGEIAHYRLERAHARSPRSASTRGAFHIARHAARGPVRRRAARSREAAPTCCSATSSRVSTTRPGRRSSTSSRSRRSRRSPRANTSRPPTPSARRDAQAPGSNRDEDARAPRAGPCDPDGRARPENGLPPLARRPSRRTAAGMATGVLGGGTRAGLACALLPMSMHPPRTPPAARAR